MNVLHELSATDLSVLVEQREEIDDRHKLILNNLTGLSRYSASNRCHVYIHMCVAMVTHTCLLCTVLEKCSSDHISQSLPFLSLE